MPVQGFRFVYVRAEDEKLQADKNQKYGMKKYYATAAALAMSIALIAPMAHAVTVDGSGTIGIDANVSGSASASNSSNTQGTDASGSGTVGADADIGLITVTRADVSSEESAQATVSTPSAVRTSADLSAYASEVVQADENVDAVAASADSVSVSYKQSAKLFGFIPIFLSATATVDSTGEVSIRYPWYAFLATTNSASLQSSVKAATAATTAANTSADASAELSAAAQAKLIDEVRAAMKGSLEASLAAQWSAGASVK